MARVKIKSPSVKLTKTVVKDSGRGIEKTKVNVSKSNYQTQLSSVANAININSK